MNPNRKNNPPPILVFIPGNPYNNDFINQLNKQGIKSEVSNIDLSEYEFTIESLKDYIDALKTKVITKVDDKKDSIANEINLGYLIDILEKKYNNAG